jgi:hypothetical protein
LARTIRLALLALSLALCAFGQAGSRWVLIQSTLSYEVSHPLHHVTGVSHGAKGEGICQNGTCRFLIAAPVRSFNSGDSNRDLHMIEVVRGALYPLITVRTEVPAASTSDQNLTANLQVQFAGQTVEYKNVPFRTQLQGQDERLTGTIPATCADFKIDRPELLGLPIKNEIPVNVDMLWRKEAAAQAGGKK